MHIKSDIITAHDHVRMQVYITQSFFQAMILFRKLEILFTSMNEQCGDEFRNNR